MTVRFAVPSSLLRRGIKREQPDLAKAYAEAARRQRIEQVAQEREKIRQQRERERGRDDGGRRR